MRRINPKKLFESKQLQDDLARKSVRGGLSTMIGQVGRLILRTVSTVILARLLTPYDFGLIAMVTVVTNFAMMFYDAGLSMATVQKDHINHDQISTLFWINALISFFLGLCVLASSPIVAWFYNRPELTAVTAVLSISFIVGGLSIQHAALLNRHMCFSELALIRISAQAVTIAVTVIFALLGWRYWALVFGSLATSFTTVVMTFVFCPWVPGRPKKRTGVRDMLKFGGFLTGFGFVNYFSRNADNILIGKFIGTDALGLYAKAYQLFMMPIEQIRGPLNRVGMPALSSLKNQPERYVKYYQRLVDIMASLTIPLSLYCVIEAGFVIRLSLGEQWLGAIPVFKILSLVMILLPLEGTNGLVLISNGYSQRFFYWGVINAVFCIASFIIGIPYGILGVAIAYAISRYVILIPSLFYCFHNTPVTVMLVLKTVIPSIIIAGVSGSIILLLLHVFSTDTLLLHLLSLGLYVVIYGSLSLLRKPIRETGLMIITGSSSRPFPQTGVN